MAGCRQAEHTLVPTAGWPRGCGAGPQAKTVFSQTNPSDPFPHFCNTSTSSPAHQQQVCNSKESTAVTYPLLVAAPGQQHMCVHTIHALVACPDGLATRRMDRYQTNAPSKPQGRSSSMHSSTAMLCCAAHCAGLVELVGDAEGRQAA